MPTVLEYKCPCCDGKIEFDSRLQQMKCPYCDNTFDVSTLRDYDEALKQDEPQGEMKWETDAGSRWERGEADSMGVFTCEACGGEIVAEASTAATHCPFCGNPVVLAGRLQGDLKPDYVIPFQLDKAAAMAAMKKHLQGKKLLPKLFTSENHLQEIKGVYVPFWLFDAEANASIRYHATRLRTWSDSRYNYTETTHFALLRSGDLAFDRVPVDGSKQIPDDLMESIEPFDFSQAVDFQTAYLSGYLADRYNVTAEESEGRANQRIKKSTEEALARTAQGYSTVTTESSNIKLHNAKAKYALLPVWIMQTRWHDQNFLFAMNGQTGKFVGNLPMDKGLYWKWWAIWSAILSAGAAAVLLLLTFIGLI